MCEERGHRGLGVRRIGALQDLAELRLDLVLRCAVHAPALTPGGEEQGPARISVTIAGEDQRRAGFQAYRQRPRRLLRRIARQMMQHTDQIAGPTNSVWAGIFFPCLDHDFRCTRKGSDHEISTSDSDDC